MDVQELANRIFQAEKSMIPIDPLSEQIGDSDIELAYQIQQINNNLKIKNGSRLVGKKIGLTSKKVQNQFNINQPDFGSIFHDKELLTGDSISMNSFFNVRAEAEIAFILGQDLDIDKMTVVDIIESIDYVLPSIELVDSRIKDWRVKITDTIADNASSSHFILGHTPKTLDEVDIIQCTMNLKQNGKIASSGNGADCLGSPINALYWLAKKMIEMDTPLEEGDIILSGSLGPMISVQAGDSLIAEFQGLGSVSINFTE